MSDQTLAAARESRASGGSDAEHSRLLTAEDLAERWQVQVSHVYRLTRQAVLPAVKLGRYYRYRLDAIEAFESSGGVAADG